MAAPLLLLLAAAAIAGQVPVPVRIDAALLAGLPDGQAVLDVHGRRQTCTGPALADVLAKLGLPHGEALRGAALQQGVLVRARDGYAVLFSLGELDPGTGATPAIVATRCDGKPIGDKDGPYRLVLPGDKRPARSVRQVASIEPR